MRWDRLAEDYLERAKSRLISSNGAYKRGEYPDVIRYSQECVEMSLKACLRLIGVEYPKAHDVSDVLVDVRENFPDWLRKITDKLAKISKKLAMERGPSVYGEEERGIPPSELFGKKEAKEALSEAKYVYEQCRKFITQFVKR